LSGLTLSCAASAAQPQSSTLLSYFIGRAEMSAEFMNQKVEKEMGGFNNMGKPIPFSKQQEAYEHCLEMGLSKSRSMEVVKGVSGQLERDKPYEAMSEGMKFLDLTGTYRLFAVLLA